MKIVEEKEFSRKVTRYYFERNGIGDGTQYFDILDDGEGSFCCWLSYHITDKMLVAAVKSDSMSQDEFLHNVVIPNMDTYIMEYIDYHHLRK